MKIYNYQKETKEYLSESMALEDPLDKGRFLIPANATTIKPSFPEENNKTVVFDGENWILVEDFRGTVLANKETGEKYTIEKLNENPENLIGYTQILPTEFNQKWDEINQKWEKELPIAMGSDLIYHLESAFVAKEEPKTDEEKLKYFNERRGLQKIFGDLALKQTFLSPVCNPLPKWFLEIALKDIESSELIDSNYKNLFISLVNQWAEGVRFV